MMTPAIVDENEEIHSPWEVVSEEEKSNESPPEICPDCERKLVSREKKGMSLRTFMKGLRAEKELIARLKPDAIRKKSKVRIHVYPKGERKSHSSGRRHTFYDGHQARGTGKDSGSENARNLSKLMELWHENGHPMLTCTICK